MDGIFQQQRMNKDIPAEKSLSFSVFERIALFGMLLLIVSILGIAARNGVLLISGHITHGGPLETITKFLLTAFTTI
jgi:hypothetical protein